MTKALRSRIVSAVLVFLVAASSGAAQGRDITLAVPEVLLESGFLKYLLPRFSLKHGIRITLGAPDGAADAALIDVAASAAETEGLPVFVGAGSTWHLLPKETANPNVDTLAAWLKSDIGRKAIEGFKGEVSFTPPLAQEAAPDALALSGNANRGLDLSIRHCGRCHVVDPQNRMNGVDNTPSFAVLRTFNDWENRFTAFYALKPHPWFTRVEDLNEPFAPGEEPTIAPVTLTLDEVDDILSFVAGIPPADLGAPMKHQ